MVIAPPLLLESTANAPLPITKFVFALTSYVGNSTFANCSQPKNAYGQITMGFPSALSSNSAVTKADFANAPTPICFNATGKWILLTFAFKNASAPIFSKLEPSAKVTVASPVHL